jgi:hypothetical protein
MTSRMDSVPTISAADANRIKGDAAVGRGRELEGVEQEAES